MASCANIIGSLSSSCIGRTHLSLSKMNWQLICSRSVDEDHFLTCSFNLLLQRNLNWSFLWRTLHSIIHNQLSSYNLSHELSNLTATLHGITSLKGRNLGERKVIIDDMSCHQSNFTIHGERNQLISHERRHLPDLTNLLSSRRRSLVDQICPTGRSNSSLEMAFT
jgi:hypothetical protein